MFEQMHLLGHYLVPFALQTRLEFYFISFICVWGCVCLCFFTDIETAQGEQGAGSEADGAG